MQRPNVSKPYFVTRISGDFSSPAASGFFNIPELLGEVFMQCALEDAQESYALCIHPHGCRCLACEVVSKPHTDLSKRSLLVLPRVNKHWKILVETNPLLWSQACFSITWRESDNTRQLRAYVSALSLWLSRAASVPVNLRFITYWHGRRALNPIPSWYCEIIDDFMRIITNHEGRWESICLYMPSHGLKDFYTHFRGRYPLYKPLCTLREDPESTEPTKGSSLISEGPVPNFLALTCDKRQSQWSDVYRHEVDIATEVPPPIDRDRLDYLEIRFNGGAQGSRLRDLVLSNVYISDKDFAKLPLAFPLLEELIIIHSIASVVDPPDVDSGYDQDEEKQIVVLANLRKLTVNNGIGYPLEIIAAPALECLDVSFTNMWYDLWDDVDDEDVDVPYVDIDGIVVDFFNRSNAPLKSFTFNCRDQWDSPKGECVAEVLRGLRTIQVLSISAPNLYSTVLEVLCDHTRYPHLKSLYYLERSRKCKRETNLPEVGGNILKGIRQRCRRSHSESTPDSSHDYERVFLEELSVPMRYEDFQKVSDAIALESIQLRFSDLSDLLRLNEVEIASRCAA